MNGEANFNWRFVFPFEYLRIENVIIVKRKEQFYTSSDQSERCPPVLTLQVWDNELYRRHDYIGMHCGVDYWTSSLFTTLHVL